MTWTRGKRQRRDDRYLEAEMNILYDYSKYRTDFIEISSEFETMWDWHQGWTKAAQHRIKLWSAYLQPTNAVPCWGGHKAHDFEKSESPKILELKFIEPAQTSGQCQFSAQPKRMVRFYFASYTGNSTQIEYMIRTCTTDGQVQRIVERRNYFSLHWMRTATTGKKRMPKEIEWKPTTS